MRNNGSKEKPGPMDEPRTILGPIGAQKMALGCKKIPAWLPCEPYPESKGPWEWVHLEP